MLLVDTSVWVDFLDGTPTGQTRHLVKALEEETPVFYTGILLQEVLQGFQSVKQRQTILSSFQKLFLLEPTLEDHIQAARIFTTCRGSGLTVRKSVDCFVAALAMRFGLDLLDNDKDYGFIAQCFPLSRVG